MSVEACTIFQELRSAMHGSLPTQIAISQTSAAMGHKDLGS